MGLLLNMSLLVTCISILHVYGYELKEDDKKTLEALFRLQRKPKYENEEVRAFECKKLGTACRGLPKCCGTLQCYWPEGYRLTRPGVCVDCVPENGKCQRNNQCCGNLQCEKGNAFWVNGDCKPKRTSGHCYQDSQCQTDCKKKWWAFTGECE